MKIKQQMIGVILIAGIAGAVFGVRFYRAELAKKAQKTESSQADSLKAKGPDQAKITVVEYSDFQCPACQAAMPILKEIFEKYQGQLHVIYRHFPLQSHLWSPLAHQSAECAHAQGKFWEFHDLVFANQKNWSGPANPADKFLEYAKSLNLDLDKFSVCLSDPKTAEKIQADKKHGEAMQVNSTPTFFINGERVVGPFELKTKGENMIRSLLGLPLIPVPEPPAQVSASAPLIGTQPPALPQTPAASAAQNSTPVSSPAASSEMSRS